MFDHTEKNDVKWKREEIVSLYAKSVNIYFDCIYATIFFFVVDMYSYIWLYMTIQVQNPHKRAIIILFIDIDLN